jgi:Bacterial Ig domain
MKQNIQILTGILLVGIQQLIVAQSLIPPADATNMVVGHQIGKQGADYRVWQKIVRTTDASGNTILTTNNAVVELATGLNYKDSATGQWLPSKEEIDSYPGGAIAQYGQHKVIFANNLNTAGAIDLQMSNGQELKSDVLGLSYYDTASGKSVLIAEIKDSQGQIVDSNQVVYADAFQGVKANVRYTYTRAGLEQDVVLLAQPPSPETFGLSSTSCVLQVLTEFTQAPTPAIRTPPGNAETNSALADEMLDFGAMKMVRGKAFLLGTNSPAAGVGKQWLTAGGRTVLVESVRVPAIAKSLSKLPAFSQATPKPASGSALYAVSTKRLLPMPRMAKVESGEMQLAKAALPQTGLVLDYTVVNGSLGDYTFQGDTTYFISGPVYCDDVTLEGGAVIKYPNDTTAYIDIGGNLNSQTGPYHPAVFTAGDDDSVGENLDDYYWAGYTGTIQSGGYADPALALEGDYPYGDGDVTLTNVRICYAQQAISIPSASSLTLCDSQIIACGAAIAANPWGDDDGGEVTLENCLIGDPEYYYDGYDNGGVNTFSDDSDSVNWSFNLYFCTIDNDSQLVAPDPNNDATPSLYAVDSIFSNIGDFGAGSLSGGYNGFYNTPSEFGDSPTQATDPPYSISGSGFDTGGYYYLSGDTFRGKGVSSGYGLTSDMLADIHQKTTHDPEDDTGDTISSDTTLPPYVTLDNGDSPDLGYHYDRLDYTFNQMQVNASVTLTIDPGVVVGWVGWGFSLAAGATINFDGTAANPCYFVRNNTVMELDNQGGGDGTGISSSATSGTVPSVLATFTHFSAITGTQQLYNNPAAFFGSGGSTSDALHLGYVGDDNTPLTEIADCEFSGAAIINYAGMYPVTMNLENCLLNRAGMEVSSVGPPPSGRPNIYLQNCTMRGGALDIIEQLYHWPVKVFDCAFDGTEIYVSDSDSADDFTCHNNAYLTGASTLPNDQNDVAVSGFNWQPGPLGNFYLPPGSPLVDANNQAGDPTADSISVPTGYNGDWTTLASFTTDPVYQTPDTGPVDIGYHYPAPLPAQDITTQLCPNTSSQYWNFDFSSFNNNLNSCNWDQWGSPVTYIVTTGSTPHGTLQQGSWDGCEYNYTYTPDQYYAGSDSFTYQMSDGLFTSAPATVTVTMTDPITANSLAVQTCRDTTSEIFSLANGGDYCAETLTYSIVPGSGPIHGNLTLIGSPTDPRYTYTPNNPSGYTGTDSFEYKVSNECGESATATINITVGDANLCPNNQNAMTGVNQPINLTLTAQDNWPDQCQDNPLTYTITGGPQVSGSTVTPASGTGAVLYTPKTGYEGVDSFTFTVSDGTWNAQCSDAQVTVFVVAGPTDLTAECNPNGPGILLNWTLDSAVQTMETEGLNILDFKIYRSTTSGGPYTSVGTTDSSQTSYLDVTATPNNTYYYVVTFEYQDPNPPNIVYPLSPPAAGIAPYSNEASATACCPPSLGNNGVDVAFIVDNTGSMSGSLAAIKNAISSVLSYIGCAANDNYRFALVTTDTDGDQIDGTSGGHDMVVVRVPFTSNVNTFLTAIADPNLLGNGGQTPESTDECLNTVVHALSASGRINPDGCQRPQDATPTLQLGDFTGFRENAVKLVVFITDASPGGFCDVDPPSSTVLNNAHQYAQYAQSQGIKINAIQIDDGTADQYTQPVMQDYYAGTTCGWYEEVSDGSNSSDIEIAILNMLYTAGNCN